MLEALRSRLGRSVDLDVVRHALRVFMANRFEARDLHETALRLLAVHAPPDELLHTARRFVDAEHSRVRTAAATVSPDFAALHEVTAGPYVTLSVTDTGSGMTKDVRERIFEPFFTTKGVGEGCGLGLSISKDIVDAHGGTVALVSRPGHTSFQVSIARRAPARAQP